MKKCFTLKHVRKLGCGNDQHHFVADMQHSAPALLQTCTAAHLQPSH